MYYNILAFFWKFTMRSLCSLSGFGEVLSNLETKRRLELEKLSDSDWFTVLERCWAAWIYATSGQAQREGMVSERGVKWSERSMNEVKTGLELKREIRWSKGWEGIVRCLELDNSKLALHFPQPNNSAHPAGQFLTPLTWFMPYRWCWNMPVREKV